MTRSKDADTPKVVDLKWGVYRLLYSGFIYGKRINAVSEHAEAMFWRLHAIADDLGLFPAEPDLLKSLAYPRRPNITDDVIDARLNELAGIGLVETYKSDGERYGRIVDFGIRQPLGYDANRNPRRAIQRCPTPTDEDLRSGTKENEAVRSGTNTDDDLRSVSVSVSDTVFFPQTADAVEAVPAKPKAHPSAANCTRSQAESLYCLYPRRVGKQEAVKAILKAVATIARDPNHEACAHPLTFLTRKVSEYAKSPAGQSPPPGGDDYRPHPATWFNQGRYDDDTAEWQKRSSDGNAMETDTPPGQSAGWAECEPTTLEELRRLQAEGKIK